MKVVLQMHVFIALFIHILSNEAGLYTCGPMHICSCFTDPWTKNNITMNCSGKHLYNLREICDNIGNATRLDASYNNITGILDASDIQGCQHLIYLSMKNNQLHGTKGHIFMKLSNLIALDLSHNKLPIYTKNSGLDFKDLVYLEILKINGNPITDSFNYPDLSGNKNLTSLNIDGFKGGNGSFPTLTKLQMLVLSGSDGICTIEKLSDDFFINLPQLEILDLSFCKLIEISMNAFSALKHLKRLDLSGNRRLGFRPLSNISYSLQFTQIDFLNYSYVYSTFGLGTNITKQDLCFLRNTTLREIALDGNRIQLLETNAIQLLPSTLQIGHFNDNAFTFGPYILQTACAGNLTEYYGAYQNLAHSPNKYSQESNIPPEEPTKYSHCPFMEDSELRMISLSILNCKFYDTNETITIYPVFPKVLKKVIFNDSFMRYILPKFLYIPLENSLEHVDISGNVLFDWEGPIGILNRLKYLDISRNYCTKIGKKIAEYMPVLENLQIHSNFLGLSSLPSDAPYIFQNLSSLMTLNMSFNKITSLDMSSFEGLHNLETLDLSYNSIASWQFNVYSMYNLTHVNLSNNALQSLPTQLLDHLSEVSRPRGTNFTIDLRENVLMYGCPTKDFLFWMIEHSNAFVGFNTYKFVDEEGDHVASNTIVTKVNELKKKCQSNVIWIVISSIGVSVAVSVIIFGLVYRNRWKLRYFMYMSKQRFYGYVRIPNEAPLENYKYDAFISYAEENIRFVKDNIIPKIEQNGISLCIHQRDFLPGNAIADNIVDAIQSSRKTVVLLSNAFLKKTWCMYEFNMARMENIYSRDGRGCLVMVLLEDVPAKLMSPELINWMKTESYIEYTTDPDGEELFWTNLAEAITI